MDSNKFREIFRKIDWRADEEKLSKELGISRELTNLLAVQKLVRHTTHEYYKFKHISSRLLSRWKSGETFVKMAKEMNFSPVQLSAIILSKRGFSRKDFRFFLNFPDDIKNRRLKREIKMAMREDPAYSPKAVKKQEQRGKMVERRVHDWLENKRVHFLTEDQQTGKTPDFLLEKTLLLKGRKINWIECKASFGDLVQYKIDFKKQLSHYAKQFGPGMVVYWYGFVEDLPFSSKIWVANKSLFK